MFEPGPALAHAVEDDLGAGAVGDIGRGEVDHQQAPVGIHGDVALTADDLLAGIITSCFCFRRLDRLAVDYTARGAGLAPSALTVERLAQRGALSIRGRVCYHAGLKDSAWGARGPRDRRGHGRTAYQFQL